MSELIAFILSPVGQTVVGGLAVFVSHWLATQGLKLPSLATTPAPKASAVPAAPATPGDHPLVDAAMLKVKAVLLAEMEQALSGLAQRVVTPTAPAVATKS